MARRNSTSPPGGGRDIPHTPPMRPSYLATVSSDEHFVRGYAVRRICAHGLPTRGLAWSWSSLPVGLAHGTVLHSPYRPR